MGPSDGDQCLPEKRHESDELSLRHARIQQEGSSSHETRKRVLTKNSPVLVPWSQTSSLHNCEKETSVYGVFVTATRTDKDTQVSG